MRSGYVDYPTRSLIQLSRVESWEGLPGGWTIDRMSVLPEHRGKGIARKLMQLCLADADKEEVTLYLQPLPEIDDTAIPYEELVRWYLRCGFAWYDVPRHWMRRTPTTEVK